MPGEASTGKDVLTWADGRRYEGEVRDGAPHGQGVLSMPDGTCCGGEWRDGLQHGQGFDTWPDGTPRYAGGFLKGLWHGQGVLTWQDGTRYEGEFRGDLHGHGVMTLSDGRRYEGEFRDNTRHGEGIETRHDGTRYEGDWRDGKAHGQGVLTFPDGTLYEGEFRAGEPHGQGVMTLPDGYRYEGDWRDGKPHGEGVETWPEGVRYEGGHRYGKEHGQGVLSLPDGTRYEGEYRDGQRHGQGVLLRNAEASSEQGRQKTRMTRWRYNIDGTIRPREPTHWLLLILSSYIGVSLSMSIFDPEHPLTVAVVALAGATIGAILVVIAALITSSVFAFVAMGLPGRTAEKRFGAQVNFAILAHVGCIWGAIAILAIAALWLAAEGSGTGQRVSREDLRDAGTAAFEAAGMTKEEIAWEGRKLIGLGLIPLSDARAEQGAYALSACLMETRSGTPHALKMETCSVARLWVCDLLEAEFREHTAYPEYPPLDFFGKPIPWDYESCRRNATDPDELESVVEQGARTAKDVLNRPGKPGAVHRTGSVKSAATARRRRKGKSKAPSRPSYPTPLIWL